MTSLTPHPAVSPSVVAAKRQRVRRPAKRSRSWHPRRIAVHVVIVGLMIIWFTPVLGLFISSVRTASDTASSGWWMAIVKPLFTGYNYQQAFAVTGIGESISTSLAISIPVTIMTTIFSAIGAFALTRMKFRGQLVVSLLLVALLVVPPQVTLVPLLQFATFTGLSGTVPAVWLFQVGFTVPFGIFLVRGFIASIPNELFESAAIDGASTPRIFRSIVLPLAMPILASLAIMQFLWSWNDLLVPLLFMGGSDLAQPMTVQIAGQVQQTGQGQSLLLASTVMSTLLPLVILIGLQRFFVRGILGGAVKG